MSALLLRRPGADGEAEMKEADEDLLGVEVIPSLMHAVEWVKQKNHA